MTDGITLTDDERTALALHFLATIDLEQHLQWEDYPYLNGYDFERLTLEVSGEQWKLSRRASDYADVDEVVGRVQA